MIEINLLPEELKVKARSKKAAAGVTAIEAKRFLYLIPLIFGLLILSHIYFAALTIIKNSRLLGLSNKWRGLEAQRRALEDFNKEYAVLSEDAKGIQQLASERIDWAQKINKLSLGLPAGVWFNEIILSRKDFTLVGSVVSLQKEEMGLINKFIESLKNDSAFFKDFNNLELTSVERKTIGSYDVSDFVLVGALKVKNEINK